MFESTGVIHYGRPDGGYKIHVDVDPSIAAYYRSLMPSSPRPGRYAPHITVLRKEAPVNPGAWGAHEGRQVRFAYDGMIFDDGTYVWLRAFSGELMGLRVELGLEPLSELARPPDLADCFHITIGNWK